MQVGIISDIHAQAGALQRALELLERRGAQRIVCAGDMVEKGPDGDAVVELLRAWKVVCVRGNHDENAIRHAAHPVGSSAPDVLRPESLAWLSERPRVELRLWANRWVMIAHGSPIGVDMSVYPSLMPKRFKRWLRSCGVDFLILGHTHQPMNIHHLGVQIVNPGSVSCTRGRDSHTCGLLELPGGHLDVFDIETGEPLW